VNYAIFLYQWILKRLPRAFSIPMVILLGLYFAFAFPLLVLHAGPHVEDYVAGKVPSYSIPFRGLLGIPTEYSVVGGIVSAALIFAVAVIGILLSYGIASIIYRFLRGQPMKRLTLHDPSLLPSAPGPELDTGAANPLAQYERIGIILAGGGAKGAYQAGAMQAIYEFLEKHQALHKVRMIAGTSIGSWNSLFWLAGMVGRPDTNTPSVLEQWWHQVDVKSVIRPALYVPLRQNYLLSPQPWEETFTRFFKDNAKANELLMHHINHAAGGADHVDCDQAIHFYLTRANVALGKLEFTTNRDDLSSIQKNLPSGLRPRQRATPDVWRAAGSVDDLHDAVFASMDIPPLFKNSVIGDELFEDGGVIDNLPIKFGTEFENCDLLFILPLNASIAQKPDQRSIVKRLFRVMDVRQGVLERNSFKMIYLYNELAALRDQAETYQSALSEINDELGSLKATGVNTDSLEQKVGAALQLKQSDGKVKVAPGTSPATEAERVTQEGSAINRALFRRHKMVQVFSICPAPELAINTAEFWKTEESGKAFRLMRKNTQFELQKFFYGDTPAPDWIRMARVSPEGEVTYLTDF
jgi:predicted acylesterase/phospholipase RssA